MNTHEQLMQLRIQRNSDKNQTVYQSKEKGNGN
jgi:hypothetical protein